MEQVEDPEAAVEGILARCAPQKLMALFGIPAFSSTAEFLVCIANKRGMVGRGGVPDRQKAARAVLMDWNGGKIPFFVMPPEDAEGTWGAAAVGGGGGGGGMEDGARAGAMRVTDADVGSSAIVAEWAKVRFSFPPARTPTRGSQWAPPPLGATSLPSV